MCPAENRAACPAAWQPHLREVILVEKISQTLKQKCQEGKAAEVEDMLNHYEANDLPAARRGDYSALWKKAFLL